MTTATPPALEPCDDAEIMRLWRECELPEYFLGNGRTNRKLVDFAKRLRRASGTEAALRELIEAHDGHTDAKFTGTQKQFSRAIERLRRAIESGRTALSPHAKGG